ncbi:MAG: hypothetical protein DMF78_07150 [Acidobacteria bacterium]|nr:MAG: hypothetical protein DMF78_07150 [Acidobacteriota bacterium]
MAEADPAAAVRGRAVRRREARATPAPPKAAPRRTRARTAKGARELSPDFSPTRYIARVSRRTGKEVPGPIAPDELLVHAHRDRHPAEVVAQFLGSRFIQLTGRERLVGDALRGINSLGSGAAALVGSALGSPAVERAAKRLLGVVDRDVDFRFRELTHLSEKEVRERVEKLQREARAALRGRGRRPRLRVLLTGATGFLGKELLSQAAEDRRVEEVVAVVRPETVRDYKTKEVLKVLTPAQRGALLLRRLHITGSRARKFRFVAGDIEKPDLGIESGELARLRPVLTHVVHCAASVSFDDIYENSFRANVLGCRNALAFSLSAQRAPGSAFVSHVAIETSYIHGRKRRSIAQENALVFPRHFYNNFYELTKAMASIETDRALVQEGLRVTQLLPSIVIGHSRTGNNRGDTKVVNAPINAFGRAKEAMDRAEGSPAEKVRARLVAMVALGFPGDETAELNLVPVDRVAGANVRLSDPTFYRNVTLPLVKNTLTWLKEPKLAGALEKLGAIFGAYNEWGQPVHGVGNDVRILGLSIRRPDTEHAFRMLCRHNRYVQEFGRLRDADETARREQAWEKAIDSIELRTGHQIGALPAEAFRRLLEEEIDLRSFRLRRSGDGGAARA